MGYDIYIGDGKMRPIEDDDYQTKHSRIINGKVQYYDIHVDGIKLPESPTFPNDDMTGNGNSRHPGYAGWSHFCEITGLSGIFFNQENGLMREHPGFQQLHPDHAVAIHNALEAWKSNHPDAVPGFEAFSWGRNDTPIVGYDAILARLIWLDWWVQWALKHCEHAGVYNF